MIYTLKRDDMPLLSQWIKKFDKPKFVEFFGENPLFHSQRKEKRPPSRWSFFFGRGIGIRTPTYRVRVCCAAVTQFPCVITDYILAHIIWFVNSFFKFCLQILFIFLLKKRVRYVIMVRVIYLSVRAGTFFRAFAEKRGIENEGKT